MHEKMLCTSKRRTDLENEERREHKLDVSYYIFWLKHQYCDFRPSVEDFFYIIINTRKTLKRPITNLNL